MSRGMPHATSTHIDVAPARESLQAHARQLLLCIARSVPLDTALVGIQAGRLLRPWSVEVDASGPEPVQRFARMLKDTGSGRPAGATARSATGPSRDSTSSFRSRSAVFQGIAKTATS